MDENGHLTNAERAAYWQRTLAPSTLLEVSDHLQECVRCREELRQNRPSTSVAGSVAYEDLLDWMEGDVDPLRRSELAERIGNSPAAAAELVNLLQFRDEMNELPARDYATAPRPRWLRGLDRAWPLAAGLILGCAFLWLISVGHRAGTDVALIDHGQRLVVNAKGEIPGLDPLPPDLQRSAARARLWPVRRRRKVPFRSARRSGASSKRSGPPFAGARSRARPVIGSTLCRRAARS